MFKFTKEQLEAIVREPYRGFPAITIKDLAENLLAASERVELSMQDLHALTSALRYAEGQGGGLSEDHELLARLTAEIYRRTEDG